jgi:thiol-disulfide isomerase/thioredoxin
VIVPLARSPAMIAVLTLNTALLTWAAALVQHGSPPLSVSVLQGPPTARHLALCMQTGDGTGEEETTAKPQRPLSTLSALAETEADESPTPVFSSSACAVAPTESERRRSIILTGAAAVSAVGLYTFQRANPVNPVALLQLMEARSPTLPEALASGKPTLVEFYAPWCIECRESAPSMVRLEKRFGDKVNFVTLNGDDPSNAQFVRLFGVDGIPHLALIGSDRKLKATLIGAAPESVVESSLDALWRGNPMPYGAGSGT